jgi:hypothetical protein
MRIAIPIIRNQGIARHLDRRNLSILILARPCAITHNRSEGDAMNVSGSIIKYETRLYDSEIAHR